MMGIGPVSEQREKGGVIKCCRHGEPAELPGILDEQGDLGGQGR